MALFRQVGLRMWGVMILFLALTLGVYLLLGGGFEGEDVAEGAEMEVSRSNRVLKGSDRGKVETVFYRRPAREDVVLVSRELVGEDWKLVMERIPERYSGEAVSSKVADSGAGEVDRFLGSGELFWAADLLAANHGFLGRERAQLTRWLVQYRRMLHEEEITKNMAEFEHEGKMVAIIGADHLYKVLLPEMWLVKAEREFLREFGWNEVTAEREGDLERGRAWLEEIGLKSVKGEVDLDLSELQWEEMRGRDWRAGVVFLREDQLFRLGWMSEKFRSLVMD